jgi:hypothetical protein
MVTIELVDGAGSYTWNDKGSIYRHTNNRTLKAKAEVFLTIQTGVELNSIFNLGENINCFIQ